MSTVAPAGEFAEGDLDRLEALLDAPPLSGTALGADALQGMLVALSIGPDEALPERWQDAALGAEPGEPAAPSPELAALLERFAADTQRRARDGTLSLLLYGLRRGRADYRSWCRGFLLGVELSGAGWYYAADADDVDELLFPIHVLAGELSDQERASYTPAAWRRLVLDAEANLDQTLSRLRDYWAIVRAPPQTVRRAMPKTGRNDPCPCGSGRKFKQCCGR